MKPEINSPLPAQRQYKQYKQARQKPNSYMADVLLAGKADPVLAVSIFHFGTYIVGDV